MLKSLRKILVKLGVLKAREQTLTVVPPEYRDRLMQAATRWAQCDNPALAPRYLQEVWKIVAEFCPAAEDPNEHLSIKLMRFPPVIVRVEK